MTARKEAVMMEYRCRRGRGREGTPREKAVTKRKGAVLYDLSCLPGWQLVQSFLFRKHTTFTVPVDSITLTTQHLVLFIIIIIQSFIIVIGSCE